jgi:YgiT-type zinc finger domain-containing protein
MSKSRCHICGGEEFEQRRVEYIYRRGGHHLIVQDVPCKVCLHCGERYYEGPILLHIEQRFKDIYEKDIESQSNTLVPIEVYA